MVVTIEDHPCLIPVGGHKLAAVDEVILSAVAKRMLAERTIQDETVELPRLLYVEEVGELLCQRHHPAVQGCVQPEDAFPLLLPWSAFSRCRDDCSVEVNVNKMVRVRPVGLLVVEGFAPDSDHIVVLPPVHVD